MSAATPSAPAEPIPPVAPREAKSRALAWSALSAAVATAVVFFPALGNGFVNWDDWEYVSANPYLDHHGLRLAAWSFGGAHFGLWIPLTWISLGADRALFGPGPFGHHLVNVLLHAASAALLVALAARLARAARPDLDGREAAAAGLLAALLFALHPLRVESVAWVAERKDVLCGFFTLAALAAWARHAAPREEGAPRRRWGAYLAALALFCAALLSKATPVALPLVLLALDFHPFGRLRGRAVVAVVEKLPFFAASAAASVVAMLALGGAIQGLDAVPLSTRLLVFGRALGFYVGKTLWPVDLLPIYPYSDALGSGLQGIATPLVALGVTVAAGIAAWRGARAPLVAWAAFVLLVLPVSGLLQAGGQPWADRFTYLPSVAPSVLLGGAGVLALRRLSAGAARGAALAGVAIALAALSAASVAQISIWRDGETLWTRLLRERPRFALAYTNRAEWRSEAGRQDEALADLRMAMILPPSSPEPYYYLGLVQTRRGDDSAALHALDAALATSAFPDRRFFEARGDALARLGRDAEAVRDYGTAISLGADTPSLFARRAAAEARIGDPQAALEDWTTALDRAPTPVPLWLEGRAAAAATLARRGEDGRRSGPVGLEGQR